MTKKYLIVGVLIPLCCVVLVATIRISRDSPVALEAEPNKVKGNPAAPISIVEFSDFVCPYCEKIRPNLKEVLNAYPNDVKIIFKHLPLKMHPPAFPAAEASECAADQNRFWDYHDILFDKVNEWAIPDRTDNAYKSFLRNKFIAYAKQLNLNEDTFRKCLESGNKAEQVKKNIQESKNFLVSGTPTCLLNGRKVITSTRADALKKLISEEKEKLAGL